MQQDLYMCGDTNFTVQFDSSAGFGSTGDHEQLYNRDAENAHPISAISGLQDKLNELA